MLGIIGGTGLYDLPGLQERRTVMVTTPFGEPSAPLVLGRLADQDLVFLPRHGIGHRWSPTDLPYRANIYALKEIGVTHLLSVSAVGSLKPEIEPHHLVVPDQVIDRTTHRPRTFFDHGIVAHVGIAEPYCAEFRSAVISAAETTGQTIHRGGTYVCIEGPQFSTKAESALHRSWGASVVGMTAMPETRLAREAELCYATLAMVTDYDVWHESGEIVSVEVVMRTLRQNVEAGRQVIRSLAEDGLAGGPCVCHEALAGAITTDVTMIARQTRDRLGILVGRYLPEGPAS
ncbi:MAG TPA: S-methyl-5'-thioadenosine phosphorylase [Thermomicrobiales bacterium]|nr:S-methyl-5'-thioadenosine phosphorylase [Thermomicrobiales bacterium]